MDSHRNCYSGIENATLAQSLPLNPSEPVENSSKHAQRSCSGITFSSIWKKCCSGWQSCKTWVGRNEQSAKRWFSKLKPIAWLNRKLPGWELYVVLAIIVAAFVLLFNVVFLVVVWQIRKPGPNGLGTLVQGSCKKVDWANKLSHGVINISSTVLLAQSNFCMQLLASPTRHEVDVAHSRRQWVDIGIPSFRNIWKRHIRVERIICWTLLVISSMPLHLLWNSAVIYSPTAFQYNEITVTDGFVRGLPFNDSELVIVQYSLEGETAHYPDNVHFLQQEVNTYERLDIEKCKREYAQYFIRSRADVVVVVSPKVPDTNTSTVLGAAVGGSGRWPYQWICPAESRQNFACYGQLFGSDDEWLFPDFGNPLVEYCLSKQMDESCKLEYSFLATIFTVAAISLKLFCFIGTYRMLKRKSQPTDGSSSHEQWRHEPLITTGDAIASFLEIPDSITDHMSIADKEDFENGILSLRWIQINPIQWQERFKCSRFRAIGVRRWITGTAILFIITMMPFIFLLQKGSWLRNDLKMNYSAIKQLGMGTPSGLFLFGTYTGDINETKPTRWDILGNVALSNISQPALSVAYYLWNTHITVMITAREYDRYAAPTQEKDGAISASKKRSLRVTYPKDGTHQKPTPYFSIPLRYALPNMVLWILLQWLASQAIFFARVDILDHWQEPATFSISQSGYSVLGMIYFTAVSVIVLLFSLGISLRKLDNRMPLAATCSGALSAACHPRDPNLQHHEKKIHWGVEIDDSSDGDGRDDQKVLHCTFTSLDAHYPDTGRFYA